MKEENGVLPFIIGLSEVSGRKVLEDLVEMEPFNSNMELYITILWTKER
jgi:hypothetical protein